jgi:hypothetical protein
MTQTDRRPLTVALLALTVASTLGGAQGTSPAGSPGAPGPRPNFERVQLEAVRDSLNQVRSELAMANLNLEIARLDRAGRFLGPVGVLLGVVLSVGSTWTVNRIQRQHEAEVRRDEWARADKTRLQDIKRTVYVNFVARATAMPFIGVLVTRDPAKVEARTKAYDDLFAAHAELRLIAPQAVLDPAQELFDNSRQQFWGDGSSTATKKMAQSRGLTLRAMREDLGITTTGPLEVPE